MSFDYIRKYYGVPVKRGGRVITSKGLGTITSAPEQYVKVRLDSGGRPHKFHPTWEMTYLGEITK